MEDENIVYENINSKDDDERFVLTPWGAFYALLETLD